MEQIFCAQIYVFINNSSNLKCKHNLLFVTVLLSIATNVSKESYSNIHSLFILLQHKISPRMGDSV